jgi:hypothetical protein
VLASLLLLLSTAQTVPEPITPEPPVEPPALGVLLQNGRVIDGTGAAPRAADIWVVDDRIVAIGPDLDASRAAHVLDL